MVGTTKLREVLIRREQAGSPETGGLELAISHVDRGEFDLASDHYGIVSVLSEKGRVRIGDDETEVCQPDHFGVPADLNCHITQLANEPLIFLDDDSTDSHSGESGNLNSHW
jgi:hypothetical protein